MEQNQPKKATLLIVDDEENLRKLYEETFIAEGYNVILADNGEDAIRMAKEHLPNIVIMDIRMPGMDGLNAMREIFRTISEIMVVLNSSYTHYKNNFMSWATDAYVVKDKDLTELKKVVAELIENNKNLHPHPR